ncbi:MAG: hypothetical protein KUA37_15020 [Desulfomicrobium sp.]|nr:hypothetical protein [Pseudomonadota bacterium]MBV1713296.1 hypothetical protein [Desulfomicrobium sp.]MBU4571399.1 hypothetical protein [Pseudomonadota bacterium]MBU4595662.1 hypothetical protein [Pseudomonadota bacterium]MBV1720103.1 hypothetical protein [Desulfomicrobium sp.]
MLELLSSPLSLEEMADALVAEARQAGSTDDVSVVLYRVIEWTSPPEAT